MPIDPAGAGSAGAAPPPAVIEDSPSPPSSPAAANARAENNPSGASPAPNESGAARGPTVDQSRAVDVPGPSADPAADADRARRPPLEITALRLCCKVKGFGALEPMDPDSLEAGRRIRVYWEMAGLEYEARGDAFVSRLAAHLELRSEMDGSVVWEQSPPTAEDVCPRRRRDYYASTLLELPRALEPGSYRLRLVQTDLVGHRTASSEIPITIVRSAVGGR
jgi:hypothetical protein